MSAEQAVFLLPYLISLGLCLVVAGYVRKYRAVEAARFFTWKALVESLIIIGFLFETLSQTLAEKIVWDDLQYVLDMALPGIQYLFVVSLVRHRMRLSPVHLLLLAAPLLLAALLATDPLHHLVRPDAWLNAQPLFPELRYAYTTAQYPFAVYVIVLLFWNFTFLVRAGLGQRGVYRMQLLVAAAACLMPALGAAFLAVGLQIGPYRDMSPYLLAFGNLVTVVALARYRLFALAPVARDLAVTSLDTAYYAEDDRGRAVDLNPMGERLLGVTVSQILGKDTRDVFPQYRDLLAAHRDVDEVVLQVVGRGLLTRGMHFEVHVSSVKDRRGRRLGRIMLFQDVTAHARLAAELAATRDELAARLAELELAQGELVRTERLATLGRTVATVSHEMRNPLGTVRNSLFTIRAAIAAGDVDRAERAIALAERGVRRCDAIIVEMLDFSTARPPAPRDLEVDGWLAGVLDEIEVPPGLEVTRRLASGARVRLDPDRLRRAVVNVCLNAFQAMSEGGAPGTRLEVESRVTPGWVELTFADQGVGMDEPTLARAGEPLFSTRTYGVGLGLSIVRTVIREHGGESAMRSAPGAGTVVVLRLPVAGEGTS